MLSVIIFSKDRPLQLDLALKSIKKNLPLAKNVQVIFTCSEEYDSSYEWLVHEYNSVEFLQESKSYPFYKILKDSITLCATPYVMFMTDDNIVYAESKTTELDLGNLFSKDIACISLRLGVNITHRDGYLSDRPKLERFAGWHLVWNRMNSLAQSYWNYPLSVDGHIFKTFTIDNIISEIKPRNPNRLEQLMQRYFFEVPAIMACELTSCVVNSPNNRVQDTIPNLHGQIYPYDQKNLLNLFNDGVRLSMEGLEVPPINCPHQEINILSQLGL